MAVANLGSVKPRKEDKEELEKGAGATMKSSSTLKSTGAGGESMAVQAPAAPAAAKNAEPVVEAKSVPATEVLSKINSVPADRYQQRREISLGGQGACKVAFDLLAEREVILKTSSAGGWSAERIVKEARYAAKFNHPNTSRLLELGAFGKDQVFMTMPFIEGSSLDQVIKKISDAGIPGLTGFSMTSVAELFDKICAGVEHAHSAGILHLDLKPQNVIVGSRGEVVVIDWGIAQALNAPEFKRYASNEAPANPTLTTTLTGSLAADANVRAVGTPAYLAPEQWAGDPGTFTERTDVYGLGGVLFYLLTGTAPNQVQRPTDLDPYFRHSPVPTPSDYTRRRVPPELDALCVKCLSRDPQQRYPSVFHVRHILKSWLSRPEMWELYRASY
jgi:eukaryotic-like serine/threonine-protein kinase